MSNGFPMAAVIGTKSVMEKAQETFISSTYWTERIGPVASLATIKKMKRENVPAYLKKIGKNIQYGWSNLAKKHRIGISVSGTYPLSHFSFEYKKPLVLKTLFTQFMLERGFLATTAFYASYAHKDKHVDAYLDATNKAFYFIAKALSAGRPERYLKGPVCHSGFKRIA